MSASADDTPLPSVPTPPAPSSAAVRAVMQGNRGKDTKPELRIRSAVHRMGLRYRVHQRPEPDLRCVADLVFRGARVAVFVDGCYWHGCPQHGRVPRGNGEYWSAKIARNVARDRRNDGWLEGRGWQVVRIWEHESPDEAARRIAEALRIDRADASDAP